MDLGKEKKGKIGKESNQEKLIIVYEVRKTGRS